MLMRNLMFSSNIRKSGVLRPARRETKPESLDHALPCLPHYAQNLILVNLVLVILFSISFINPCHEDL